MDKRSLSERDICTMFIPVVVMAVEEFERLNAVDAPVVTTARDKKAKE